MGRSNFKDIGLNNRVLQNIGIFEYDIPYFAPTAIDPHVKFREALKNRDLDKDKTDEEKKRYKEIEEQLMIDTLRKTCGVITTLSKKRWVDLTSKTWVSSFIFYFFESYIFLLTFRFCN